MLLPREKDMECAVPCGHHAHGQEELLETRTGTKGCLWFGVFIHLCAGSFPFEQLIFSRNFRVNGPATNKGAAFLLRNIRLWGILQGNVFMEEVHPQAKSDMLGITVVYKRSPHQGKGRAAVGSPAHRACILNVERSAKTHLPVLPPYYQPGCHGHLFMSYCLCKSISVSVW